MMTRARIRTLLKVLLFSSAILIMLLATGQSAQAQTCNPSATFTGVDGNIYNVQNNAYNLNSGAQQCITVNTANTSWSVTSNASVSTSGAPSSYPSIYAGCHWGTCSPNQQGMPIQLSSLTSATSSWNVTPSPNGNWDIAYDIWTNPNSSTSNNSTGMEIMIWINHLGVIQPAGSVVASNISIAGMTWTLWANGGTNTGTKSYVANSGVNSVNFDLNGFFKDLENRGYLTTDQFLIDVEAGTEIWTAGSGFAENSFSVCANCGGTADFSISASPSSQTVIQGNSTTYTMSVSPSNGFSGTVSLSASGLPSGASANFNPGSISGGSGNSTLTVSTSSSTPTGSSTLTITGASGSLSHSTTVNLTVNAAPPPGQIAFVTAAQNLSTTGGSSIGASLSNNASDALVVACREGADTTSISSVTDSTGNIYNLVNKASDSGGGARETAVYLATNISASSSNRVSCNFASNLSTTEGIVVEEFSNVHALDANVASSSNGTAVTSLSSGNLTTTQSGDALIYVANVSLNVTWTAGNGYAIPSNGSNARQEAEYEIAGAAGSYSASVSWNAAGEADGVFLALTSTGGGTPPPAPTNLTATAGNTQVSLSWTASSGATSYNVLRGTSSGGESPLASGVTTTSYTDKSVINGTTYFYVVQAVDANGTSGNSNEASATPQGTPDFSISASPGSQTVTQGGSTTYTVSVSALNGFTGTVSLSASGMGSGASASFSPTSISGAGNSTLTISTTASAATGTFTITIKGTSGSLSHSTTVTLIVNAPSSGNCHTGSSCVKGTLPASQNYSNFSQIPSSASNSTYVASIWIKGTGSVQLYIKAGNWGSNLTAVQCTASSSWTQCSTPSFSTGSNTQLTFIVQDTYAGAGTVYIDDVFLGVSGGTNILTNPGFESGSSGWSISNSSTWAIGQF